MFGPAVPPSAQEVPNPIILVEVLSPSTGKRGHGVKRDGYFTLPSLRHYVIVDPDRALVIHHRRGAGTVPEAGAQTGPVTAPDSHRDRPASPA
jgi:Uma2 family endonuclease